MVFPTFLGRSLLKPAWVLSGPEAGHREMDRRYKPFAEVMAVSYDANNELSGFQALPLYSVIVIDELADIILDVQVVDDTLAYPHYSNGPAIGTQRILATSVLLRILSSASAQANILNSYCSLPSLP